MNTSVATVPTYSFTFSFEDNFDREGTRIWIHEYYRHLLCCAVLYLVVIYLGQKYMEKRKPYDLRWAMVIWNSGLAAMSALGAVRMVPELIHVVRHFGLDYSLCSQSYYDDSPVTACWVYIFGISKLYELFDTLFVILRKQNLIFLHWFHHCSVLIFTTVLSNDGAGMGRWFISMNLTVHTFMYTYYALRSLRVRVPRNIAMSITTAQILQMLVGFYISICGFAKWYNQEPGCDINTRCALLAISIYSFYFYLFVEFFVKAYLDPESVKARLAKNTKSQ